MSVKILGCAWIVLAVLLLLKPQAYKRWIEKNRQEKYILFMPLAVGALLMYVGLQFQGLAANILVVLGAMGVLKTVVFLNAKVYNKLIDWALTLPLTFYRVGACVHIGIGLILLSLS